MDAQQSIDVAAREFDRTGVAERAAKAEAERQALVQRFPMDAWPEMRLEEYALGQERSEDTFCRWLEFRTPSVASMKGGSARKHLIYKHAQKPGWHFDSDFESETAAWESLRSGFVDAFNKAQAGEWNAIDDIAVLAGAQALRSKTLYCYFPDDLLPINSYAHLKHFFQCTRHEDFDSSFGIIRLNRRLLEILRSKPEFSGWSNWEMMAFLYDWADPRESRRIVKIAPGENAMYWEDCLGHGYICVGWDEVGDLSQFESKDEFFARYEQVLGERYRPAKLRERANELWTLTELEPGDVVVANKGTSQVLAVGKVVDPGYEFRPDREKYQHTVKIAWDTTYATEINPQKRWALVTVAKVPMDLYQAILSKTKKPESVPVDPLYEEIAVSLRRKGQVILYGPPGTGKTYAARRVAVWWLLQQAGQKNAQAVLADPEQFADAERKLSTVQVSQRVWWIVANPSQWGWGCLRKKGRVEYQYGRIQRNYPLVQPGDLVIGYQSYPDKKMMALARVSRGLAKNDEGNPSIELSYLHDVDKGLTYAELLEDPILSKSEPMRFRNQGTLFALDRDEADHALAVLSERDPAVAEFSDVEGRVGQLTRLTFHASYSYEDFIEGFRPVESGNGLMLRLEDGVFKRICREAQANPDKPYLVLIDEFNRANVAKVFGELVTLLESDKRGLIITLPQSKESFAIPSNVFVLGTMNTADRSIKLLDSAMRRRFAFIELMPDVELIRGAKIHGLDLADFLLQLNARIAEHAGREKQIGHSFLMENGHPVSDPEEFARRFRQEILPLLQEYCYDDYGALAQYLGSKLVDPQEQVLFQDRLAVSDILAATLEDEFQQDAGGEA
jgi:5-methylcytosine-specific restriction enzyme B